MTACRTLPGRGFRGAGLAGLLATCLVVALPAAAAPSPVETEIARLAADGGGVTGVAAWRLDGEGPRVLLNPDERFPMASTFKIAVAGAVLAAVDDGELRLDQMVPVEAGDLVPWGVIEEQLIHPGIALSVHNLLELMLTESDNTATDVLLRLAGGPAAVTAWVRRQGVADLQVDRDTAGILRHYLGWPPGPLPSSADAEREDARPAARNSVPNPSFADDPRDTSTPVAMATLLTRIFNGSALGPDSTRQLIAMMERCRTGAGRLAGRMPAGTILAHKTGTLGGSVNDVGVLTLPAGAGQVVIAVFVKNSDPENADRERVIAEIARTVRDYYLFREP